MVADSLVYHPSVAHYLKFVATTVGRDKLLRTLQYFSRFYAWYLFRTNGTPAEIAPFEAIKKQFGLARKLMRVGKNVEHFKAAAVAADSKNLDPVVKYCAVGRQLGYAGYLSFDAITVLDAAGIRKSPATQRLQREAYRFWMIGLLFSAVSGTYSLYQLRQQQSKIDKKDGEGVVAAKRIEKYNTLYFCKYIGFNTISGSVPLSTFNFFPTFAISLLPLPQLD
jgi:peroxin-11B